MWWYFVHTLSLSLSLAVVFTDIVVNISSKCFAIYFKVGYSHSEIRNASHCDAAHHSRHLVSLGRWWISSCAGVWAERESRQWEQERVTDIAKCHRALVIWQTWYFGHDPLPAEKWACVCSYLCVCVCIHRLQVKQALFYSSAVSLLLLWCSECQFISVSLTSLNSKGTVHCNPSGSHVIETDTCWRGAWAAFILGTCPSPSRVKRTVRSKPYQSNLGWWISRPLSDKA